MFRKRNKSEVQAEYTCSVRFLDDEPMQFTFKKDTIGQWLLDRVSEKLNLIEKDYFGLRYIDTDKQRHWLDPLKTVYKQLKESFTHGLPASVEPTSEQSGITPIVLCFRVKFYPEDPMKLREEITRYYMFLQLRRDLHHGRLLCSPDDAVYLAAYIVQSEVGDYDPEDHPPGYISEFKMLPKQTPRLEERVMEQHRALRGQVPAEAEGNFLKRACTLDTYGVDPHQVKDQKADMLYLGITYQGIMTFRGSRRTQLYKWTQIRRLSYEGKMFIVNVSVNEKQQPVTYKCQTASAAKYLWRSAVEQQLFFTLASASTAPKLRSGGSLFSRGSKFRFSGRCQSEAYEASQRIHRQEPNFPRSSSLPSFNRRHGSASSRSSAVVGHNDSSILDDSTTSDDRRRYNEVAVDVPRGLTMMMPPTYQSEVRVESKTIRAPLAPQETYEEQPQDPEEPYKERRKDTEQQTREIEADADIIIPASVAIVSSAPPPQLNGQVVREVVRERLGSQEDKKGDVSFGSESYKPNSTFDNFDVDETEPKSPVMEEMQQTVVNPASAKHNHLADGPTPTTVLDPPTPNAIDSPTPAPNPIKKRQGSGCGAVVGSVLVAVLLLATLLYVLYFSGWQHPLLTQARSHLTFLEPARDLLARHGQELVTFFSN